MKPKKKKKEHSEKLSTKAGLPPGSLVYVGPDNQENVDIQVIDYSSETYNEHSDLSKEAASLIHNENTVTWVNINGIHEVDQIEKAGDTFNLHSLTLEDILNSEQRPKVEFYDNYVLFTLKMLGIAKDQQSINTEQVSIVLGTDWVVTFQEKTGDVFGPLRARLKEQNSFLRNKKEDYLFYRLIDIIVDNYFFVVEHLSDKIENLEIKALEDDSDEVLREIQSVRKEMIDIKHAIIPLREALMNLSKEHNKRLNDSDILPYFKDVYDHVIQIIELINTQHEVLLSVKDLYFSGISNKMNRIMQVLTIISTIFIPLTFLSGIYGMNFEHMPELGWKYSYPVLWGIMMIIVAGMLIFFRKRKWL